MNSATTPTALTCNYSTLPDHGAPPVGEVTNVKRSCCVVYPSTGAECCMPNRTAA